MVVDMAISVPQAVITDFGTDLAASSAAFAGTGCGPGAIVCVPVFYVTTSFFYSTVIDEAIEYPKQKFLDEHFK